MNWCDANFDTCGFIARRPCFFRLIKITPRFDSYQLLPPGRQILLQKIRHLMSAILILLIASISVAGLFLGAFIWSIRSGQYDDEFSPPQRILFEDRPAPTRQETK